MRDPKQLPKLPLQFFRWFCKESFCEEIEGDLIEQFHKNINKYGATNARWIFGKEVLLLFRPGIVGNLKQLTQINFTMETIHQKSRLILLVIGISILLIPLIAMQFTQEVKWDVFDFVVATGLLATAGFTLEIIINKIQKPKLKIILALFLLLALLLVWAELAVGVFGSIFAGS